MDALLAWDQERAQRAPDGAPEFHDEVWLLGQPPLRKYLDFVVEMTVGGADLPRSTIVDEWRQANDYYAELESREAGVADGMSVGEIEPSLRPLAREVMSDARWTRGFDTVPARIAMVELDRLVMSQPFVNLQHVERLKDRLSADRTPQALFRFCLPLDRDEAPVQMRRAGSNKYLFWSESSDFRFHEPALLRPDQLDGHHAFGPVGGILGLMVGYGSNFLNAIECDGRLLLHNGYHRAYALRDAGITHAPCIVQTVTRRDELQLVASHTILEDVAFYLKAARPPILKDFFDPKIRKILRVPKVLRVIELSFKTREFEITDFATNA